MDRILHAAFIMDGNSSWSTKAHVPQTSGYLAGMRNLARISLACQDLGIQYATFYAFSTENWLRPPAWVKSFMALAKKFFREDPCIDEIKKSNLKLKLIGDTSKLDSEIQEILADLLQQTAHKTGSQINLAISYGARNEIVRACQRILDKGENPSEESLAANLDTAGIPDPDLIIRTSGKQRLSNFLLWQASYSELFFTKTLWPDFDKTELGSIVQSFYKRKRTYGK